MKNQTLRRALNSAILSAGAWADKFNNSPTTTYYFPDLYAGKKTLSRAGRMDLYPALEKRAKKLWFTSLTEAKERMW